MTKVKQTNAIATMVKTSQGATVKVVSAKPSLSDSDLLSLASQAGTASVGVSNAELALSSTSEVLNKVITNLKNGGFIPADLRSKEGKGAQGAQTRLFKAAFIDTVITAGKTEKTAQLYYDAVSASIKSGKPVNLNPAKSGAKNTGDKKPVAILDLLAKVFNHADFEKRFSTTAQSEIEKMLVAGKYL